MPPIYWQSDDGRVQIFHAKAEELIPLVKCDAVVKEARNSPPHCVDCKHENSTTRIQPKTSRGSREAMGQTCGRNTVSLSGNEMDATEDCRQVQCDASRNAEDNEAAGNSVKASWVRAGGRESKLQTRTRPPVVSSVDFQGQVRDLSGNGQSAHPSQELRPLRRQAGEPASALRFVSHPTTQAGILATAQGTLVGVSDPTFGIGYIQEEDGGCLARSTRFVGMSVTRNAKPAMPLKQEALL